MSKQDSNSFHTDDIMNQGNIDRIKEILCIWNPLGKRSMQIHDLDNYNAEAIDIISNIEMDLEFKRLRYSKGLVKKVTKQVINEAFNMWLTDEDCEKPSELIYNILLEK